MTFWAYPARHLLPESKRVVFFSGSIPIRWLVG